MRRRVPGCSRAVRSAAVLTAVVVGVTSVAAPAGAATLHAPVIHERWTLLPCTGKPADRTTLQLEGCGEHEVQRSDATIDALNAKIFARLQDSGARRDFIAGHNAWLAYRNAYCVSESDVYQGGTLSPVIDIECEAAINTTHIVELTTFLADLHS